MTTQTHQPWKPTCWVGGLHIGMLRENVVKNPWISMEGVELQDLVDDDRRKYAATKATAAILRSMRK